jgi:hypothetical protein
MMGAVGVWNLAGLDGPGWLTVVAFVGAAIAVESAFFDRWIVRRRGRFKNAD